MDDDVSMGDESAVRSVRTIVLLPEEGSDDDKIDTDSGTDEGWLMPWRHAAIADFEQDALDIANMIMTTREMLLKMWLGAEEGLALSME